MNGISDRIIDVENLNRIRDSFQERQSRTKYTVLICAGAGCISCDCVRVQSALITSLHEAGILEEVQVKMTGCMGICDIGPVMLVQPGGIFYCKLRPDDMKSIVQSHLLHEQVVESLCSQDPKTGRYVTHLNELDFFNRQKKIVLKNCGKIDYGSLEEYIAQDGFYALEQALRRMTPEQVVDEVKLSGLRGRGGGGFPTGIKWALARKSLADRKYIICNADEGDPGAFMDRSLLEGDPFALIEGMTLGGYAIGASNGYVYVRAEYPLAIERLSQAITQAEACGLLGEDIFGSDFSFRLQVRIGAGAFVCGEETALMNSVEGKRGEPLQKPPFPSELACLANRQ